MAAFTGSLTNGAPDTVEMVKLWRVKLNDEHPGMTCIINGHEVDGYQIWLATVAAPSGVNADERELILISQWSGSASAPTRLFARFTPAAQ